jgi:hypothetical protein
VQEEGRCFKDASGVEARRILAVRRRLLNGLAGRDVFTGLLPATQTELSRRCRQSGTMVNDFPQG